MKHHSHIALIIWALTTATPGLARTRQAVDIDAGRGISKITYKDSDSAPAEEIESKTIGGRTGTLGISYIFFTKETYGLPQSKSTKSSGSNPFGLIIGVVSLVQAIAVFPATVLLIPGVFLPSTMKVAVTGRSTTPHSDDAIYFGSQSQFRSIAANFRLSMYPIASEYISFGYSLGVEQGFSQMSYTEASADDQRDRIGSFATIGYNAGVELTRSYAASGPFFRAVYHKENPLIQLSGTVNHPPEVLIHQAIEAGWRVGF